MKAARPLPAGIEILEARVAPATLSISGGVLSYTAGSGVANVLTITSPSQDYMFVDSEAITLGAGTTGWTGNGTTSVRGPAGAVSSLNVQLNDLGDTLTLAGVDDPITANGGTGTDTITVSVTIDTLDIGGGTVSLNAETLNVNAPIFSGNTTFIVDTLNVNDAVSATGRLSITPTTANRPINLGTEVGTSLSITSGEFAFLGAPAMQFGSGITAGSITISDAITPQSSLLAMATGGTVTQTAPLIVPALRISSTGAVTLTNAGNDVDSLSGTISAPGADFSFRDADDLIVDTVDGVVGITTNSSTSADFISLNAAGAVTQTAGANISATFFTLAGAGPFTLTNSTNTVGDISANITGALSYTDADALNVGSAGGFTGITSSNAAVTLTTVNGPLTVQNDDGNASADLDAGSGFVTLVAGSVGAVDRLLTIEADAGVIGTGGVLLVGDNISIAGPVTAGGDTAQLLPFQLGTPIDLGGADGANTLGLTDAELERVTAAHITVGSTTSGTISLTAAIDLASTTFLSLRTGANIVDDVSSAVPELTETNLSLEAVAGIGSAANPFDTKVSNFEAQVVTGGIFLANTSAVTIGITGSTLPGLEVITSGDLELTATGSITLAETNARVSVNGGGDVSFTTGANGLFTCNGEVDSSSGDVTVNADRIALAATADVSAPSGTVALQPVTAGRLVNLGSATDAAANTLELSDAELDRIITPALRVGSATAGSMTISAAISRGGSTALTTAGSITVSALLSLTNATLTTVVVNVANGGTLSIAGTCNSPINVLAGGTLAPGASPGLLTAIAAGFAAGSTFSVELNGLTAGTQYDQLAVTGGVALGGATLTGTAGFTPSSGDELVIIRNASGNAVSDTFAGLPEGATVTLGAARFSISYAGGDGDDVTLSPVPLAVTVDPKNPKIVTFIDVDGDLVKVTSTKPFDGSEFIGVETGANHAGQLQTLKLDGDFKGANITFTAKPGPTGGNGFVNLGFLDARGVDLGAVKIAGDLGRIFAGTVAGDPKVPALKSLTVQSFGLLGTSTQGAGASDSSIIDGALPTLKVAGDWRGVALSVRQPDGRLGAVTIGGSLLGATGDGFSISAVAGIGSLKVGGDIRVLNAASIITSDAAIGPISVGGMIDALSFGGIQIHSFGKTASPAGGLDLALQSLNVRGSVRHLVVFAGTALTAANADAAIGAITVGGDWIESTVRAGVLPGFDNQLGTADDAKFAGAAVRDEPLLFSTIQSITIKGQAIGTASAGDMFTIVAERIGSAKVGGRTLKFLADTKTVQHREAFFAAPTGPGAGTEAPQFDFTIREIGSTTPLLMLIANLDTSAGKVATFTDVDGDIVRITTSIGAFEDGDFTIVPGPAGGGQLQRINLTDDGPEFDGAKITITATPGPAGGNGFVNVGFIDATGHDLGDVFVDGDLGRLLAGDSDDAQPAVKSLTAHSLGALGTSTQPAGGTLAVRAEGVLGKLTVQADLRETSVTTPKSIGSATIGGMLFGGQSASGSLNADRGIGSVKIGGSMRGGAIGSSAGPLGAISIGGDLSGGVTGASIFANGQLTAPLRGLDTAIKSLAIKGSVERALIVVGANFMDTNADGSIGAITVGHAWLGSNVTAGVEDGIDDTFGTTDDIKIPAGTNSLRDVANRFSTIASIVIKGQAIGSAATFDTFGIVAEQIGSAKIGTATLKLVKGARNAADAFALAPTGPGATGLRSDFFLREVTI